MLHVRLLVCLLVFASGCAHLPSISPSSLRLLKREAPIVAQPALADPSNQDLAIAWETAKLAEQRGMDQEAIKAYLEVRKHDATKPGVAHALAVLYDRSGMTDAASREYQAALSESPDDADLHCDYGYFMYWTGKLAEADASLRKALKLQPGHKRATVNLALVLGDQGQFDEAQKLFTQAIGPAAAMHNVGMLHLRAGNIDTAKQLLAEAKRLDPSIDQSQSALQWIAAQQSHSLPVSTATRATMPLN